MDEALSVEQLRDVIKWMNRASLHQCNRLGEKPHMAVHPLTCGQDSQHGNLYPLFEGGTFMLICPDCDYTQIVSYVKNETTSCDEGVHARSEVQGEYTHQGVSHSV